MANQLHVIVSAWELEDESNAVFTRHSEREATDSGHRWLTID